MKEIVLSISGASGAPYAKSMIQRIISHNECCSNNNSGTIKLYLIFSDTAKLVWNEECGDFNTFITQLPSNIEVIENNNFNFKFASGSNYLNCMIILPASMGAIGRIASGISTDLISRIADVQLKERRPLYICPRETPLSRIHLSNMLKVTEAGAIITPCAPSFYNRPSTLRELLDGFVTRLLDTANIIQMDDMLRW